VLVAASAACIGLSRRRFDRLLAFRTASKHGPIIRSPWLSPVTCVSVGVESESAISMDKAPVNVQQAALKADIPRGVQVDERLSENLNPSTLPTSIRCHACIPNHTVTAAGAGRSSRCARNVLHACHDRDTVPFGHRRSFPRPGNDDCRSSRER